MTDKYKVLPQRNQFGMIVITDINGEVVKNVKSITAASEWIIKHDKGVLS